MATKSLKKLQLNNLNKLAKQIEEGLDITFRPINKKTLVNLANKHSIIDLRLTGLLKLHFQAIFLRPLDYS
jgi:hypothetical protein